MKTFKVGEIAKLSGVTVRTLHHYEEIGLVVPSERTEAGHRVYNSSDVEKLQQVVALKSLGFSLDEIKSALASKKFDAAAIFQMQLSKLNEQVEAQRRLVKRLERLVETARHGGPLSTDELFKLMEETAMIEKYYTEEQLDELKARKEAMGDEAIKAAENDWQELIAAVKKEMAANTDPKDPRVVNLARRWMDLVKAFTGGNPGIQKSLSNMWSQEKTVHGFDTAEMRGMMAYIQAALKP